MDAGVLLARAHTHTRTFIMYVLHCFATSYAIPFFCASVYSFQTAESLHLLRFHLDGPRWTSCFWPNDTTILFGWGEKMRGAHVLRVSICGLCQVMLSLKWCPWLCTLNSGTHFVRFFHQEHALGTNERARALEPTFFWKLDWNDANNGIIMIHDY